MRGQVLGSFTYIRQCDFLRNAFFSLNKLIDYYLLHLYLCGELYCKQTLEETLFKKHYILCNGKHNFPLLYSVVFFSPPNDKTWSFTHNLVER